MKRVSLTPAVFHLSNRVNKIAESYGVQPIVPRGPALKPILDRLRKKVTQQLKVQDTHETVVFTSSGSGAIAAAVGSCIDETGIMVIANDAYGHRQADFCEQLGIRTIRYQLPPGEKPDVSVVKALVKKHQVRTIGMVHGCTSVCLLNPVYEIGALAREMNLRLIVDAIASVFVEEIDIKGWGIDVLICSANKGLHSNPDLSFCVTDRVLLEEISGKAALIPYFDMGETWNAQKTGSHPFTINIRALLEFEAALDDFIERGGLEGRIQMYNERLRILREGYKKLGLTAFAKEGMPFQNIGTALYLPENVGYDNLAQALASWNNGDDECYEIYSAQGALSGIVFRIFNMGEYPLPTYNRFINALETCIKRLQP